MRKFRSLYDVTHKNKIYQLRPKHEYQLNGKMNANRTSNERINHVYFWHHDGISHGGTFNKNAESHAVWFGA